MSMDFRIEELSLEAAVDRFREPWEAWVVEHGLNISHLPDWLLCAARGLDVLDQVRVSIAHGPHGAVGFVPWTLRRRTFGGIPYRSIETGACLPAYHPDWLAGKTGGVLLRYLREQMRPLGAHAIAFTNIPVNGATAKLVAESDLFACRHVEAGEVSPVINLPDDWESYLEERTGKFRNTLRRKLKKYHGQSGVRIEWFKSGDDVPGFLELMLEIEAESWKMPAGIAIRRGSPEHHYYQHLLPWLASRGAMVGLVLWQGEEPAAYALRYLWQGEMGGVKSTYKVKYKGLSPGTILQEMVMHYAFDNGIHLFDFLGNADRHKEEWANGSNEHCGYICFAEPWRYRLGQAVRMAGNQLKGARSELRNRLA